ncbi:MAG: hypothetical protein JOZ81_22965 [Chloroflexi bacterium]|nr:hypothetical protein [Chloroflexota bacterium]
MQLLTQVPLHNWVPVGQAQVQVVGSSTSPSGQVGTHLPWHSTKPALQTKPHLPLVQTALALAGALQAFPQVPQFVTSDCRLTQVALPQQVGDATVQQVTLLVPTPHTSG